jgi:2-haloacid dehalogenase
MGERVLVFDVNETLLDLSPLDPVFASLFGSAAVRGEWFGQVLQSAMLSVATGVHRDFGTIGRGALRMVADRRAVRLEDDDVDRVLDGMRHLPPHPDVPGMVLDPTGETPDVIGDDLGEVADELLGG